LFLAMTGRSAIGLSLSGLLWLWAAGSAATGGPEPLGQANIVAQAKDAAKQLPAFEVAAIKPNKTGGGGSHSSFDGIRLTATNISVKSLIQYDAYAIPGPQILGGPNWLASDRFDIEAKVDDAVVAEMAKLDREQRNQVERQMVQQLLADRFKLSVHFETKELHVYALVVAKGGPKLTESKDPNKGAGTSSNNGRLTVKGTTMQKLAQTLTQNLARELGRVVIDKTGIQGKYDLALAWSPESNSAAMVNASNEGSPPGPSIFTALQEQLGLKLESAKGPVETLVIDHIEQPSEN
jgi:uncharacterized protein (TIGR03435 family)